MATSNSSNIESATHVQAQLNKLFGSYKAEWLKDDIFELFTEPAYFPDLTTPRSCILIGGRGTGKTTALRGLSYLGQAALARRQARPILAQDFIGLYHRVNTNHVTAFDGPDLDDVTRSRLFAHYVNLLMVDLVLEFVDWASRSAGVNVTLESSQWSRVAASLNLPHAASHGDLRALLTDSLISFEAYINNVVDAPKPLLSLQSAPVDLLTSMLLQGTSLRGKQFFFLIDEYENLLDYQQRVFNTLIKHASTSYAFKIGVRELGLRCRTTLNANEQLIHPADYARVNIAEKLEGDTFRRFAADVFSSRFSRLASPAGTGITDVRDVLPSLSEDEEASLLGVDGRARDVLDELERDLDPSELESLRKRSPLEMYFLGFWARAKGMALVDVFHDAERDAEQWRDRFNNYKHVLLFTIREGKRGIRKYYAGWLVLTQLAAGNIRYLLELVAQSILEHLQSGASLGTPVDPKLQTQAAQQVGRRYVSELEGLSVHGAQLTKLLLALGRIFGRMAAEPVGHTPEVNQFHLADADASQAISNTSERVDALLHAAVMHLALVRLPGTKPADVGDTKDSDYMMHPVFAPFFEFSHRRKRRMALSRSQVLDLVERPKRAIRAILEAQHRALDEPLPQQLLLFEGFYDGGA